MLIIVMLIKKKRCNLVKEKTGKSQEQRKCRMCIRADKTINHIVSECPKLAQKEYKRGHEWIGRHIHWEICRANGVHVKRKWYEQKQSLRMTRVECFEKLLFRQTIK